MREESDVSASDAAWRALVEKASGRTVAALASLSADGVPILPLYPRSDDTDPGPWRQALDWSVAQRVDHPDPAIANASALLDLEGGANVLTLVYAASPFARGFGLAADVDLDAVLAGIEIDFIALRLDAGDATLDATRALTALIEKRVLTSADLTIDFGYDPIGLLARTGRPHREDDLRRVLDGIEATRPTGRALMADGRAYHEAGAGEALELASILATGVAYLRRLERIGIAADAGRDTIAFLLACDADVFLGLAKVRALRRLWARVEAACELEPHPIRLHAETSWRMMARLEPWTNVMRATAATFAAGVGGVDAITVLPFTLAMGLPDDDARRLARNVQRVLLDEANLAKVADPAAGTGGFEAITDALCEKAWELFQAIEAEGGIEASLRAGALRTRIAESARARTNDIALLRRSIVGISRFPSLTMPAVAVLDVMPRPDAAPGDKALPSLRDAAPFEVLRDEAAARAERPRLFLATLGAPAAFGPRTTYAANIFAAAGIETEAALEERDIASLVEAFRASGARAACLCGTAQSYARHAVAVAAALREAGARRVLVAGSSSEASPEADIDAAVHDGCDVLAILRDVLAVLTEA